MQNQWTISNYVNVAIAARSWDNFTFSNIKLSHAYLKSSTIYLFVVLDVYLEFVGLANQSFSIKYYCFE